MSDPSSAGPPVRWIPASDQPFGVEVLDIRAITSQLTAWSGIEEHAQNAITYRQRDGRQFIGKAPRDAMAGACELAYACVPDLPDGRWFCPRDMEDKWALYHYENRLYFVRSWRAEVVYVATTRRTGNTLALTAMEIRKNEADFPFTERILDFIIKSHALGEMVPAPLPKELDRDPQRIALYCFSMYGYRAAFACYGDAQPYRMQTAIRADSDLLAAVMRDDVETAERLIGQGAPLDTGGSSFGLTPLHLAAIRGHAGLVDSLIDAGATIDVSNDAGRTPLHELCSLEAADRATVERLLERGANAEARATDGTLPLHLCAQAGSLEVMRILLARGVDVNGSEHRGFTALHQAAEGGLIYHVRELLSHGANPNARAGNVTPLDLARRHNHEPVVELLCRHGAGAP